ncbi:DUF4912 domain-containing protein [Melittangium boletus]|uniref:DUF4912 domain-containing protein n=1 Tax=Melittangium boletus DSM 14713 TaxID=1294270 RepID=A0A286NUS9_9BACT|nr:DUF4912 domain-containing protein [Melittangium boletus]ATB26748.1 hypothetical protein MEBOL_000182 [Melittangium boletus DSM 14713]
MADLKSVMVEHLRQLAHTHLERGKGRPGLLGAIVRGVSGLVRRMGLGPPEAPVAASSSDKPEDKGPPATPRRPLPGDDDEKTPVYVPPQPARVVTFPPKPKPHRPSPDEEVTLFGPQAPPASPEVTPTEPSAAEPLVEGFFVARIAGEEEASRHHLTGNSGSPPPGAGHPDSLGGLPREYGDDTLLLLPRDPHTLFVLWDFSAASRQRALAGLESPSAVLRLFNDQGRVLSTIDISLESRGYYLHGLPAAQPYRVEVHFVGRKGGSRRIGPSSNRVFLPPSGPSPDTSVRFLRVPPLTAQRPSPEQKSATPSLRVGPVEERAYITWRRVTLPGSVEAQVMARRQPTRDEPGTAPEGGAPSPEYLHAPRMEGSSERAPAIAAPEGRPWFGSSGPVGSSEQAPGALGQGGDAGQWLGSIGRAGSSEQVPGAEGHWYWSSGPVGSSEQGPGQGEIGSGWSGAAGPAGSSEQGPGAGSAGQGEGQWVWWYGAVGSSGPAGSSEQWVGSYGPAGASEQGALGRPDLPSSPVR